MKRRPSPTAEASPSGSSPWVSPAFHTYSSYALPTTYRRLCALAWLQHVGGPDVIPIPGTTSIEHLDQNLAARRIALSEEEVSQISAIFDPAAVAGLRYPHNHMTFHANPSP